MKSSIGAKIGKEELTFTSFLIFDEKVNLPVTFYLLPRDARYSWSFNFINISEQRRNAIPSTNVQSKILAEKVNLFHRY